MKSLKISHRVLPVKSLTPFRESSMPLGDTPDSKTSLHFLIIPLLAPVHLRLKHNIERASEISPYTHFQREPMVLHGITVPGNPLEYGQTISEPILMVNLNNYTVSGVT